MPETELEFELDLRDDVEETEMGKVLEAEGVARPVPTPGRIVWYQTDGRNGLDYILPAMVTVTRSSHPGDYPDGRSNPLPVPTDDTHIHLTILSPGGFGTKIDAGEPESDEDFIGANKLIPGSGSYVEHDVPFDPNGSRRTWRWPDRS